MLTAMRVTAVRLVRRLWEAPEGLAAQLEVNVMMPSVPWALP